MIEIEKKAKINNRDEIYLFLEENAKFLKEQKKEDIYFAKKNNNDKFSKENMFRMRFVKEHYEITFKEKRIENGFEINDEKEFIIRKDEKDAFLAFINHIGYIEAIRKYKSTLLYLYKGAKVELNYIENLGDYLEIEILSEDDDNTDKTFGIIDEIFKEMKINKKQIETRYYIEMLFEKFNN